MKRTLTLFALAAAGSVAAQAQVTQSFENDQLLTYMTNNGTFFRDVINATPGYRIPKDQDAAAIYMMGLLAGGTDANGQLKAAMGDYTQSDWFPGPIAGNYNDPSYVTNYGSSLWAMHKDLVDYHIAHWQDAGYSPDPMLASWPGNGNTANGESHYLAPFADHDGDGIYNPFNGDYPLIRGDHALFSVINDGRNVHPSGSEPIGLEVHALFYLYDMPENEAVSQTTFMNFTLVNRGTQTLYDFHFGAMMDFDLGNYLDDYIGTMVSHNLAYAYNSDLNDEDANGHPGYGVQPPAIGVTALNADLHSHVYIDPNTYPANAHQFYNLLQARTSFGNVFLDDDGNQTNFVYTETEGGWNEGMAGNPPGDRRTVISLPPITLAPNAAHCYDLAIVYGESNDGIIFDCVNNLAANTATVRSFYDQQAFPCFQEVAGTEELSQEALAVYPNPVTDVLSINGVESGNFRIATMDGKTVLTGTLANGSIDVSALNSGYYFVTIAANGMERIGKFVKQ